MKKIIIIVLIFIIIIIGGFLIINKTKKKNELEDKYRYAELDKIGYNKDELDFIYDKLDNDTIDILLKYNYQKDLKNIINHKDYKAKNLNNYLEMKNKFSLELDDIIYIVNDNSYQENITYNEFVVSMIKENYYLKDRLNRYIDYHDKNSNKTSTEVIQDVNSNLDYEFYTNTSSTDTTKGILMIVNKYYKLDKNYVPDDLVDVDSQYGAKKQMSKVAYDAFINLFNDAKKQGYNLYIASPYRSYDYQTTLYNNYVKSDGKKEADTYSARPGYSEHQTGLAADIMAKGNSSLNDFEKTKEFTWMINNSYKYGFILRYPKGKEYITGYIYEPWHYRYVGKEAAKVIYEKGLTYEEYYAYYVEEKGGK